MLPRSSFIHRENSKKSKFDCYSTTLLYSKFQNHELIRSIGESIGKTVGFLFIMKISEPAGKKESKHPNNWKCTGSNTAAVYTVRKNDIINNAR